MGVGLLERVYNEALTHFAQALTYIRASEGRVGLLANFQAVPLRNGIHRPIVRRE